MIIQTELPFKIKSTFLGTEIYDNCAQRHPRNFTIVVKSIKSSDIFHGIKEASDSLVIISNKLYLILCIIYPLSPPTDMYNRYILYYPKEASDSLVIVSNKL